MKVRCIKAEDGVDFPCPFKIGDELTAIQPSILLLSFFVSNPCDFYQIKEYPVGPDGMESYWHKSWFEVISTIEDICNKFNYPSELLK